MSSVDRAPSVFLAAACAATTYCLCLGACQRPIVPPPNLPPPFTQPQPAPDWSDPRRQGRASIEGVKCRHAYPRSKPAGSCVLEIEFQVVANSEVVAMAVGDALCIEVWRLGKFVATMREADGTSIPLVCPVIRLPARGRIIPMINPILSTPPKQRLSGDWECSAAAYLHVATIPIGAVELAIDGEALRRALLEAVGTMTPLQSIPDGGLTAGVYSCSIPEPKSGAHAVPKSEGAEIGR